MTITAPNGDYLTVKQAAERLGLSTKSIRNYVKRGVLAYVQITPRGRVLVSIESINRHFKKSE